MTTTYQPGSAYAVVGTRGAALLDPRVAPEVVEAVWGVLGDAAGGGVGAVLQVLTGAFGTSLTTIPPFAVVDRQDDGLHLAVRGGFAVRVHGATGSHAVSGEGVSTWHERLEADADEVELIAPGAVEAHPALPLGTGVVLACAVRADLRSGPGPAVPPLRAPSVAEPSVVPSVVMPTAVVPVDVVPTAVVPTAVVPTAVVPTAVVPTAVMPVDVESTRTDVEGDYDFLWGSTVLRSIEDAAVRVDPEEEDEDTDAVVTAEQPVVPAAPAPDPDPVPGSTPVAPRAPAANQGGWTPPALLVAAARPPLAELGDHDGETILGSSLAGLRTDAPPVLLARPAEPAPTSGAIAVLARRCVDGHPNPPEALLCLTCGRPLDGDAVSVLRPSLGRVRLSTGQEIPLDRPLVVGRKPRVSRVQNDNLPRLVTVPSPEQDISRSHLEVRLEGWHVLLVDLGSTNGSTLLRPGQAPVRLHPQEATLAVTGDVVDLGDGVQLTFEDLP